MPVHQLNRNDLRVLARMGDLDAAVTLAKRARVKTLKGLIANVCSFEVPLDTKIFDTCCDAADQLGLPWELPVHALKVK